MSSMAEVTEEKGDLEKALHYYKLAEDETNSRRLEKIVEPLPVSFCCFFPLLKKIKESHII